MSYVNGRIVDTGDDDGVSVFDVQQALGNVYGGGTALTVNSLYGLCTHDNINMWAKYKPQRTANQNRPIAAIDYATRKANNFGIVLSYCGGNAQYSAYKLNELVHNIMDSEDSEKGWEYKKPIGTISSPYRISDFARHPQQKQPTPYEQGGDPTGLGNQGYNHYSEMPCNVVLLNVTEGDDGVVIANKQDATPRFVFESVVGADFGIKDFVDFSRQDSSNKWRPIIQVFQDSPSHPNYSSGAWWQNVYDDTYVKEVVGEPLEDLGDSNWSTTVDLPVTDLNPSDEPTKIYHVCVGIACCSDDDSNRTFLSSNSLFVVPYSAQQALSESYPFYYKLYVEPTAHVTRTLTFTGINYLSTATTKLNATEFRAAYNASGELYFTMTITKGTDALHFVRSGVTPDGTRKSLEIKVTRQAYGVADKTIQLVPANSNWGDNATAYVASGDSSETVTLYGKGEGLNILNIGDVGDGTTSYYRVTISIDGSTFTNAGSYTIYKSNS